MPKLIPGSNDLNQSQQANVFMSREERRELTKTGRADVPITLKQIRELNGGYLCKDGAVFHMWEKFLTALNLPETSVVLHYTSSRDDEGQSYTSYKTPIINQKEGELVLIFGDVLMPLTFTKTEANNIVFHVVPGVDLVLRAIMKPVQGGGNNISEVQASWARMEQDPALMMDVNVDYFIPIATTADRPGWQEPAKLTAYNAAMIRSLHEGKIPASIAEYKQPRGANLRILEPGLYRTVAAKPGPFANGKPTVTGEVSLVAGWNTFNTPNFAQTFDANFDSDTFSVDVSRYFKSATTIEEFNMGVRTCWFVVFPLNGVYNDHVTVLVSTCVDCVDEDAEFWHEHLFNLIGDTLTVNAKQNNPYTALRAGYIFDPYSAERGDILAAPAAPGLNPAAMAALPATPAAQSAPLPWDFDAPAVNVAASVVTAPAVAAPVVAPAPAANVVTPGRRRVAAPAAAPVVAATTTLEMDF